MKPKPAPGHILPVIEQPCDRCGNWFEQPWRRVPRRVCNDCRRG